MKTSLSLSGGKSSGIIPYRYGDKIDYINFALVLTDDPKTAPSDKGLMREILDRVPQFVGTTELPLTLQNVLRIEQEIGREIKWVVAYEGQSAANMISNSGWLPKPLTFDRITQKRKALPDKTKRFCTSELKIQALFWHTYLYEYSSPDDMVLMMLGLRMDELHRWERVQKCKANTVKFPYQCPVVKGYKGTYHNWKSHEWRVPVVPLIEDRVDHFDIMKFWADKGWQWPQVSNCAHCFFHDNLELQHNYDNANGGKAIIDWAIQLEKDRGARFEASSDLPKRLKYVQPSVLDMKKFSCFCTD